MVTITLRGREIPLLYTTQEMLEIQEKIAPLDNVIPIILGKNPEDREDNSRSLTPEHLKACTRMIVILGNAGIEECGEQFGKPDLTEKWVARSIRPVDLPEMVDACIAAWNEGMVSEIPKKKKEGPVDVVLEEIEEKKDPEGSPT